MTDLLRRAWDALDAFKQAYPENWHDEDEQVLKDLMSADFAAQQPEPVAWANKRDYFAGQAIQAVFAKNWEMFLDNTFQSPEEVPHEVARDAYAIADAMIAAREVKP
jgi:hypothetical protein